MGTSFNVFVKNSVDLCNLTLISMYFFNSSLCAYSMGKLGHLVMN